MSQHAEINIIVITEQYSVNIEHQNKIHSCLPKNADHTLNKTLLPLKVVHNNKICCSASRNILTLWKQYPCFVCGFSIHISYRGILILCEMSLHDSSTLRHVWFCIHNGYGGIMILHMLSLFDSFYVAFLLFCFHICYGGIMILSELSQCDSSNLLCVWLCFLIGYRGITILCELPINESSILLCVFLY